MKTIKNITYPAFALFAFACFALSPQANAQCPQICDGNANTALGDAALISNTTGFGNTAIGWQALLSDTSGGFNTATGGLALSSNTGTSNTATGYAALTLNTIGANNTATGIQALNFNTIGGGNSAHGAAALYTNDTGSDNTATGYAALFSNRTGNANVADGASALDRNRSGGKNTAMGFNALYANTIGNTNIAVGYQAGFNLTTGSNNIDIGNAGVPAEANTIRVGTTGTQTNTYIAGISGATVPTGVAVIVDSSGHLGTTTSSARFKEGIRPMDKASQAILALQPVTFRYKHDLDPEGIPQFGLVAEQVDKVNPDLVARDQDGKPYSVRYEAVNAMLLNEFLKAHQKIEEQESRAQRQDSTVAELKSQVQALTAALKEQAAQIRKVSAQLAAASPSGGGLELSKSAPQTVLNNQ